LTSRKVPRQTFRRDRCSPKGHFYAGNNVSFTVHATGAPLHYQWYLSNATQNAFINGAISPTLSLSLVTNANAGSYYV